MGWCRYSVVKHILKDVSICIATFCVNWVWRTFYPTKCLGRMRHPKFSKKKIPTQTNLIVKLHTYFYSFLVIKLIVNLFRTNQGSVKNYVSYSRCKRRNQTISNAMKKLRFKLNYVSKRPFKFQCNPRSRDAIKYF